MDTTKTKDVSVPEGVLDLRDKEGRFRTSSLFIETNKVEADYPSIYTLRTNDRDGRISFKRKYLEISDTTEWLVAQRLLGSWDHWKKLCNTKWFQPFLEDMREELKIKLRSHMFHNLRMHADVVGPTGLQASKYIYEDLKDPKSPARGRPTKQEKQNALNQELEEGRILEEDGLRVGIKNGAEAG